MNEAFHNRGGKPKGFSLVELLVVIAIIALLISILLPSMRKSRQVAKQVVCQSNLRVMAQGFEMYRRDYKDRMPPYDNVNGLKCHTFWMSAFDPYHVNDDVRNCPETVEDPRKVWGTSKIAWGAAGRAGGFICGHTSSFVFNAWLHGKTTSHPNSRSSTYWRTLTTVKETYRTPIWGDGSWVDAWPRSTDRWPASLAMGSQPGEPSMGRFTVDRHGREIDLVFIDGSARRQALDELWTDVVWHRNYRPRPAPTPYPY